MDKKIALIVFKQLCDFSREVKFTLKEHQMIQESYAVIESLITKDLENHSVADEKSSNDDVKNGEAGEDKSFVKPVHRRKVLKLEPGNAK